MSENPCFNCSLWQDQVRELHDQGQRPLRRDTFPHIFEEYPQNEDFPNTVFLFELGCAHPALRVTENIEIIAK